MALDNFRTIELIWDKANKSIIKTIKTASSDTTGRYFSVKVLDEGQEVDLTGAKLQLYWEHPNFNTSGTDDFSTVNDSGLFKLTFSDEMLTNIGKLNAHLVLTLTDGEITSDGFPIEVFKGAIDGVVVPTNGNDLVKQVANKIDKGNVTLNDLTQEVKLAMTGGSVAIVGENAVGTENIKDGTVTTKKIAVGAVTPEKIYGGEITSHNLLLFPNVKWVNDTLLTNTGNEAQSSIYVSTRFIEDIEPNTEYVFSSTHNGVVNYYDANGNFLEYNLVKDSAVGRHITVSPNNASKVRLSFLKAAGKKYFGKGTVVFDEKEFKYKFAGLEIDNVSVEKLNEYAGSENILDGVSWQNGKLIDTRGELSDSTIYKTSEDIVLDENETHLTFTSDGNGVVCFYLKDGTFNYNLMTDYVNGEVISIPENVSHMSVSVRQNVQNYQVEYGKVFTGYSDGYKLNGLDIGATHDDLALVDNKIRFSVENKATEKLKDLAPAFYRKWKLREEDLTVAVIGDSISTMNYYTSPRDDSMYRPPLMIEHAYPTYIEELLRWEGQEYKRFDVPNHFEETFETENTLEYDTAWDWQYGADNLSNNNKPAITRVLNSNNVSSPVKVTYTFNKNNNRTDFIFRTDYLSAENATVIVGDNQNLKVEVYDENTETWVEANGFVFSAKENDEILTGNKGTLRKSIYQKRLKMRVKASLLEDIKITIQNNGAGRLCYWGVQESTSNVMIDFLAQARGGHGITALRTFEEWDIDEFKPDLILSQNPVINQGINIADPDTNVPKTLPSKNQFSENFLVYLNDLKSKVYAPEIINWTVFFHRTSGSIQKNNNSYNFGNNGHTKITVFEMFDGLQARVEAQDIKHVPLFRFLWEEIKEKADRENRTWYNAAFENIGTDSDGITIDGTHLNNLGAKYVSEILKPIFVG